MAKTKTWTAVKGKTDLHLMCNNFYIDVLNREMPGGVARKHRRSKEKK